MPADHTIFQELNHAQWLWYLHNFLKDQEEEFNSHRDFVEYHASFIEPQSVHKIRQARKKAVEVDDSTFAQNVADIFGRPLPNAKKPGIENTQSHSVNIGEIMKNMDSMKNKSKDETYNYKHWAQFKLE